MGVLDSIGLGSVAKVLDVGGLVKNVVDGVLPHQLASVGDFAGAVVDFKTGNISAALQHALETMKDLPQVARGQQPPAGNTGTKMNPWPTLPHEPPPPPLASRQGKDFDWNDLLAAMKALTAALNKQGTPGTAAAPPPATTSGATKTPASTSGATTKTPASTSRATTAPATTSGAATTPAATTSSTPAAGSSPRPQTSSNFAQDWTQVQAEAARHRMWRAEPQGWAGTGGWRGQPVTSAPANRAAAPSDQAAPAATAPAGKANALDAAATAVNKAAAAVRAGATAPAANNSAPATTGTGATKPEAAATAGNATTPSDASAAQSNKEKGDKKTGAGQPSTGQTISSVAQLNGMSDAAIRDAVINGRISPDLLKDQGAMMVLQQRMQAITEMNNLMTAMMRAIHDMQMAIVQNIRI